MFSHIFIHLLQYSLHNVLKNGWFYQFRFWFKHIISILKHFWPIDPSPQYEARRKLHSTIPDFKVKRKRFNYSTYIKKSFKMSHILSIHGNLPSNFNFIYISFITSLKSEVYLFLKITLILKRYIITSFTPKQCRWSCITLINPISSPASRKEKCIKEGERFNFDSLWFLVSSVITFIGEQLWFLVHTG